VEGCTTITEVPLHTVNPNVLVSSVIVNGSSESLRYSTVSSSTILSSWSYPFKIPTTVEREKRKERGAGCVCERGTVIDGTGIFGFWKEEECKNLTFSATRKLYSDALIYEGR